MKNLENNLLFKSINKNDLPLLLKCLQANKITYQKDQTIIHQGQSINEIGILLSGKAHIINDDYWGNQTIIKEISNALFDQDDDINNLIKKNKSTEQIIKQLKKEMLNAAKNQEYELAAALRDKITELAALNNTKK